MTTLKIAYTSNFNYCETFGYLFCTANRKSLTCPAPNSTYLPFTQKSSHKRNGITLKRNTAITQYTHGHERIHGMRAYTTHTHTHRSSSSSSRCADSTKRFDISTSRFSRTISATRLITMVN